jgi:hypothetical protein
LAFRDRIRRAIGGAFQRLGRAITGAPPTSPQPQPTQQERPQQIQPTQAQETVLIPTASGAWVPATQPVQQLPSLSPEVIRPQGWEDYEVDWVYLTDAAGFEMEVYPLPWPEWDASFEDWYRLTTEFPGSYLREIYGFNNIDILSALEREGFEIDWELWKQDYEASFG